MNISQKDFEFVMLKVYLEGYKHGRMETMQTKFTPNDIRNAFDFPNIVKEKENE